MKKTIYEEGDWFAVPLRKSGFATAIIVRCSYKTKIGLGYFFGPKTLQLPDATQVNQNKAGDAILIAWFGILGIIQGIWPIIKYSQEFNKSDWPVPLFRRIDSVTPSICRLIEYEQDNPIYARPLHEIVKDAKLLTDYPDESLYGSGAIEIKLTKILKGKVWFKPEYFVLERTYRVITGDGQWNLWMVLSSDYFNSIYELKKHDHKKVIGKLPD